MNSEVNPEILEQKMGLAFAAFGGALNAGMIWIGDQLGLYQGMHGAGVFTPHELAGRLGLSERFVREWLYHQAAGGVIEYRGEGRFEMLPEAGLVFADRDFPLTQANSLQYIPKLLADAAPVSEAFRSGIGRTYDAFGEDQARAVDALLGGWNRSVLVSEALPCLDGVVGRLKQGARVADVGCGAGTASVAVGRAFPNSEVHGYDNSVHALSIAEEERRKAGVENVAFHNPDSDPLPGEPTFDLIMTLDCLHDMARPDLAASAIRKALKPDGIWFIGDIEGAPTPDGNLEHPMAPMFFGFSVWTCLQSSTSAADGLGLGTFGLPEPAMRELVTNAGFTRFERVNGLEHPLNAYYQARL